MKIVCDSCGAKYSIADEKVAGKVFKIRCKKCSAVIVVRGDQVAEPQEEAPAMPAPDAIWHVVIDGDQQGPFVLSQLGDMLGAGTIDWDTYVWREGFDGWLAARDVPEVVEGLTGSPAPAAEPAAAAGYSPSYGNEALAASPQESYGSPGLNPFGGDGAAAEVASGGGLFGGGNAGADLFAQSDMGASPFDGGAADDVIASTPPGAAPAAEDQAMTGQRNENSVLFSLANLQALATGPEGAPPSPAASTPAAAAAGQASGEGSGLIDIRALASTTGTLGSPSSIPPAGGKDKVDDLLSIGTGSAFGSSLGAPVLAPVQEEKSNRMVILGAAAVVGISVLAAAAVVAVVALRDPPEVAAANQPATITAPPGTPAALTGQATPPGDEIGATAPGTDEPATGPSATPERSTARQAQERSRSRDTRRDRRDRNAATSARTAEPSAPPAMQETPPPSMTSARRGNDIDSLLEAALGGGSMMRARTPAMAPSMAAGGGGNLPDTPPRDAVARGLRSVSGAVRSCGAGQHGVANTTVVIAGSTGRVQSARVAGAFAGTPVGSCVARAVRGARFPRFSRSSFSVTFPYSI